MCRPILFSAITSYTLRLNDNELNVEKVSRYRPITHIFRHILFGKHTRAFLEATHTHVSSLYTSVRVTGDDKWRSPQSKPICTSIRRGPPNGDQHAYFTRREAIHLSQNVAPGRWDKGPREKGGRETDPIQFKYLGEKSKCLAKHLLSKRIKLFPLAL